MGSVEGRLGGSQRRRGGTAIAGRRAVVGLIWGHRGRGRRPTRRHGEKKQTRVELPEAAPTDKHVRPAARVARFHGLETNGGVLAGKQTHALELLQ